MRPPGTGGDRRPDPANPRTGATRGRGARATRRATPDKNNKEEEGGGTTTDDDTRRGAGSVGTSFVLVDMGTVSLMVVPSPDSIILLVLCQVPSSCIFLFVCGHRKISTGKYADLTKFALAFIFFS